MIELLRSTCYYRPAAMPPGLDDTRLVDLIGDIQDDFSGYGYRRVTSKYTHAGTTLTINVLHESCGKHHLGAKLRKRV